MAEERAEKALNERFDEVNVAFAEMRDFTTFCFDKLGGELRVEMKTMEGSLRGEMKAMEGSLRGEMKAMESSLGAGIAGVNRRLDRHDLVLSEILGEVKALRSSRSRPES